MACSVSHLSDLYDLKQTIINWNIKNMGNILLDGLQWSTTSGILRRNLSISNEKNHCAMDIVSRSLALVETGHTNYGWDNDDNAQERKRLRLKLPFEGWCMLNTDGAVIHSSLTATCGGRGWLGPWGNWLAGFMKEIDHFSCRDAECRHFMIA